MNIFDVLAQFDVLLRTPDSVRKGREFILKLAFYGYLSKHRPGDMAVEKLLKEIRAEKERLYREGEIRKPRKLQKIKEGERWHEVPKHWKWTKLGEVGRIVGGGTPRTKVDTYWADRGIPWLTPGDLNGIRQKTISRGDRDISAEGLNNSSAQLLPAGSILFSSRAPIGYVAIAANELATNQGFKSIRPYMMEMNEFVYYFLKFAAGRINQEASGTTFTEVSGKEVANIPFPLPPLKEQKRIVEKVDRLVNLCDRLEGQIDRADHFHEQLVNVAFGGKIHSPVSE